MLLKCRECGGQVSSGAASCPHCGFVPPRQEGGISLDPKANLAAAGQGCKVVLLLLLGLFVAGLAMAAFALIAGPR